MPFIKGLRNPMNGVTRISLNSLSSMISLHEQNQEPLPILNDAARQHDIQDTKNPVPNFKDAKAAYASKTTTDLLRAAISFHLCRIPILVENAEPLLKLSRRISPSITDGVLKATLFGHFCAGENVERIRPVLQKLDDYGIGSILDYAAEDDGSSSPANENLDDGVIAAQSLHTTPARGYDYESEAKCDRHVEVFKKCIHDVASLSGSSTKDGYAAIKVTALGNPKLLERMSRAIVEAKKLFEIFDKNNDGFVSREEFEQGYK